MSRIQFNLLPDVKLQYLKTHRTKNLVMTICVIASGVSLTILLLLLFTVQLVQKKELKDAQTALNTANSQLSDISDLNKIVTVQNQLSSLANLHQNKHATDRIFDYLKQVTPSKASINRLNIDLAQNTMSISGNADAQKTVNTYVDTLKFTTFKVSDSDSPHPAFTNVVETSFAINAGNVSYQLDMSFDPKLFANNLLDAQGKPQKPQLNVPTLTTTRSAIDDPSNQLFQQQSATQGGQ
jgi:Tfp pilus assembly protein PilN